MGINRCSEKHVCMTSGHVTLPPLESLDGEVDRLVSCDIYIQGGVFAYMRCKNR
jgi:hypothetical protein